MLIFLFSLFFFGSQWAFANPYPDPSRVPQGPFWTSDTFKVSKLKRSPEGIETLRLQIDWVSDETGYRLAHAISEKSGTTGLVARAATIDTLGSYHAYLKDESGKILAHDSIGTGKEFRRLSRALSFRFPLPIRNVNVEVYAENPITGKSEQVINEPLQLSDITPRVPIANVQTWSIQEATMSPSVTVTIYADGYSAGEEQDFLARAKKVVSVLKQYNFPELQRMNFLAVFAPSKERLGLARDLGGRERDSFLGLFYPYWNAFGRWFHVVYPTSVKRYRDAIASAPYDYPIALIKNVGYWGVGNFNELTAIPSDASQFGYLLIHELGHFFGLNEEYEGGGRTELEFAPEIDEPFSQNMTFLRNTAHADLKWKRFVETSTPLPTPASFWRQSGGKLGAYLGGYGDSGSLSHKPGFSCVMEAADHFCDVCRDAIARKVRFDAGVPSFVFAD